MTTFHRSPERDIYQARQYDDVFLEIFGKQMQSSIFNSSRVSSDTYNSFSYNPRNRTFLARGYREVMQEFGVLHGYLNPLAEACRAEFRDVWLNTIDEWNAKLKLVPDEELINVITI